MSVEGTGQQAAEGQEGAAAESAAAEASAQEQQQKTTLLGGAAPEEGSQDGAAGDGSEGDGKEGEQGEEGEEAAAEGAPETYAEFQLPDGMQVDTQAVERFTPLFKELDLSQEKAQKLVSAFADMRQEEQGQSLKFWEEQVDSMKQETQEYFKAETVEKVALAGKAIDKALSKERAAELRQFFNDTGLGNKAHLTELLAFYGKMVSPDPFVENGGKSGEGQQERMYPSANP